MIHYRRLYESENSDIHLYDTVRCGDYDWFVIGIEGDIVTLLAKYNNFFHDEVFSYTGSNEYKTSYVRDCLGDLAYGLDRQGVNPIPTNLPDVGCTDKVWLLSLDEAKKLPQDIRKFTRGYWLRTPSYDSDGDVAYVFKDGDFTSIGMTIRMPHSIRPTMRVRIEDLE